MIRKKSTILKQLTAQFVTYRYHHLEPRQRSLSSLLLMAATTFFFSCGRDVTTNTSPSDTAASPKPTERFSEDLSSAHQHELERVQDPSIPWTSFSQEALYFGSISLGPENPLVRSSLQRMPLNQKSVWIHLMVAKVPTPDVIRMAIEQSLLQKNPYLLDLVSWKLSERAHTSSEITQYLTYARSELEVYRSADAQSIRNFFEKNPHFINSTHATTPRQRQAPRDSTNLHRVSYSMNDGGGRQDQREARRYECLIKIDAEIRSTEGTGHVRQNQVNSLLPQIQRIEVRLSAIQSEMSLHDRQRTKWSHELQALYRHVANLDSELQAIIQAIEFSHELMLQDSFSQQISKDFFGLPKKHALIALGFLLAQSDSEQSHLIQDHLAIWIELLSALPNHQGLPSIFKRARQLELPKLWEHTIDLIEAHQNESLALELVQENLMALSRERESQLELAQQKRQLFQAQADASQQAAQDLIKREHELSTHLKVLQQQLQGLRNEIDGLNRHIQHLNDKKRKC